LHQSELLYDVLIFLLAAIVVVTAFRQLKTSPIIGYLVAGALIGPYGLAVIRESEAAHSLAEFGVVFLLFMIGLEFSRDRLKALAKLVFGLGGLQVVVTGVIIGGAAVYLGASREGAIIIGFGLALSSTAFVLQLLVERGERTTPYGNTSFAILLFQDLAIVPLLMLVTLLGGGHDSFWTAMGLAILEALVALFLVVVIGRLVLRPTFRIVAETQSSELFVATTLLVILGTGWLLTLVDLSMVLGAFLAGLLLSETEYRHQIESDIQPFKGILLGLFFMTVGMSINTPLVLVQLVDVALIVLAVLVVKSFVITMLTWLYRQQVSSAIRTGLILSQGGEFGFILFLSAGAANLISQDAVQLLLTSVALTMATTPLMASAGEKLSLLMERRRGQSTTADFGEISELEGHVIILGFGRVGQTVAKLLNEAGVANVALDMDVNQTAICRASGYNVFFGDGRHTNILQSVGAKRAIGAVVTIDQSAIADQLVAALKEVVPNLPVFARARDLVHVRKLEKLGVVEAVPEALEASLQLGAITLASIGIKPADVSDVLREIRKNDYEKIGKTIE
jgi:CPA2 family monovalent cation:H+ antiporter-2